MKKIIYRKLAKDCTNLFSFLTYIYHQYNYLGFTSSKLFWDFVIDDGLWFFLFIFNYTLLSFPKIFSRIYPFAIFLAFSYILLKYEEKMNYLYFGILE